MGSKEFSIIDVKTFNLKKIIQRLYLFLLIYANYKLGGVIALAVGCACDHERRQAVELLEDLEKTLEAFLCHVTDAADSAFAESESRAGEVAEDLSRALVADGGRLFGQPHFAHLLVLLFDQFLSRRLLDLHVVVGCRLKPSLSSDSTISESLEQRFVVVAHQFSLLFEVVRDQRLDMNRSTVSLIFFG